MWRYLPFILIFILVIYSLIDCAQHDSDNMPGRIPKPLWILAIIVFPAAGAIAWIVVSRVERHSAATQRGAGQPGAGRGTVGYQRPQRRSGPLAPDDDPEFLAKLDLERRRAQRQKAIGADADAGLPAADAEETPATSGSSDLPDPLADAGPAADAGSPEEPDDESGDDSSVRRR